MRPLTKILISIIIGLLMVLAVMSYFNRLYKSEMKRQTQNTENLLKEKDQELVLTRGELSKANTVYKHKIDSLTEANDLNLKRIKQITLLHITYKDTADPIILYNEPILKPDNSYTIPISVDEKCWGMKGRLLTMDKNTKLAIDERSSINDVQLVVLRSRFLGFLWWRKKTEFKGFSDCGQVNFTKIDFIDKKGEVQ